MTSEIGQVLVASSEIEAKVSELGERITEDYRGERPLLVGILRGAVVVMSDLMRRIELPCEIDFMEVSSYG
jgi:hypoxanthine phosphoribosyltransferase